MPLIHSGSKKALKKNIETEMHAHPDQQKRNLAIAYSVMRHARKKHMAEGGMVENEDLSPRHDAPKDAEELMHRDGVQRGATEDHLGAREPMERREPAMEDLPMHMNPDHKEELGHELAYSQEAMESESLPEHEDMMLEQDVEEDKRKGLIHRALMMARGGQVPPDDVDSGPALAMKDTYPDPDSVESNTQAQDMSETPDIPYKLEEGNEDQEEVRRKMRIQAALGKSPYKM